jgi:hypothetical protein
VNNFCRIALNIAAVYAIQEALPVKTPFNALLALMALSAMTAMTAL